MRGLFQGWVGVRRHLPENGRVLDRIEWSEGRATRHLTVEGWRPGVEVAVRIPHELLAREARLLVHGAPFTVEPGTHTFDLPLSRDETTNDVVDDDDDRSKHAIFVLSQSSATLSPATRRAYEHCTAITGTWYQVL